MCFIYCYSCWKEWSCEPSDADTIHSDSPDSRGSLDYESDGWIVKDLPFGFFGESKDFHNQHHKRNHDHKQNQKLKSSTVSSVSSLSSVESDDSDGFSIEPPKKMRRLLSTKHKLKQANSDGVKTKNKLKRITSKTKSKSKHTDGKTKIEKVKVVLKKITKQNKVTEAQVEQLDDL